MIKGINIYWGSDKIFERETEKLTEIHLLTDIINQLDKNIYNRRGGKNRGRTSKCEKSFSLYR